MGGGVKTVTLISKMLSLNPIYSALGGKSATLATHTARIFFFLNQRM